MLGGTLHPKGHTGLHVWLQGPSSPRSVLASPAAWAPLTGLVSALLPQGTGPHCPAWIGLRHPPQCAPHPRGSGEAPPASPVLPEGLITIHSVLLSWPQAPAEACGAGWVVATGSPRHQDSFGNGAPRTFNLYDATGSLSGPWGCLPGLGQRPGQCLSARALRAPS